MVKKSEFQEEVSISTKAKVGRRLVLSCLLFHLQDSVEIRRNSESGSVGEGTELNFKAPREKDCCWRSFEEI